MASWSPQFRPRPGSPIPATPRFLRARNRRFLLLMALLMAGLFAVLQGGPWLARALGLPVWTAHLAFAPYSLGLVVLIRWANAGPNDVLRRVRAGELFCWDCGYTLTGLGAVGVCPECGTAYDAAELRDCYLWKFNDPKRPGAVGGGGQSTRYGDEPGPGPRPGQDPS
ncbi:MAG: hypothetical protein IBJ11_02615 [Phycisphaerales bacterium]|nr:hypothetical protein [Phycisphaerales bacterium]